MISKISSCISEIHQCILDMKEHLTESDLSVKINQWTNFLMSSDLFRYRKSYKIISNWNGESTSADPTMLVIMTWHQSIGDRFSNSLTTCLNLGIFFQILLSYRIWIPFDGLFEVAAIIVRGDAPAGVSEFFFFEDLAFKRFSFILLFNLERSSPVILNSISIIILLRNSSTQSSNCCCDIFSGGWSPKSKMRVSNFCFKPSSRRSRTMKARRFR